MLIVEGPDGAGKTTLVKELSEYLNIPVAPRVVTQRTEAMIDLRDWVDNNLEEGFQRTIFDRYRLISETIYGPILRDQQHPGFDDLMWLGERLQKFYNIGPILIYCLPKLEVVQHNLENDEDNEVVLPRIKSIYSAYINRAALDFNLAGSEVYLYDYTLPFTIEEKHAWFDTINKQMQRKIAA